MSIRYLPALDGLRAFAVLAVLLYHGQIGWARGGYLGVDAFFVLSGFLITTLLWEERARAGRVDLRAFWARRARRLLPALFLVLVAVALYAATWAPAELRGRLRGDGLSTLFYSANWRLVFSGQSYWAQFLPSPLRHAWSLAIEEQFYLLWPLLFVGLAALMRGSRRRLAVITAVLAGASAVWMAVLFNPHTDPSRVYYSTDTRAQSLLIGACLAFLLAGRPAITARRARVLLNGAALTAMAVLLWWWSAVSDTSAWLYRGGFAVAAVLVAIVITSVTQPQLGLLGRLLAIAPLRGIGKISYGLYLWHWPIYVAFPQSRVGVGGWRLLAFRLGLTFLVATLSYVLVESPIRHGKLRGWHVRVAVPSFAAALAAMLLVTTVTPPTAAPNALSVSAARPSPTAPGKQMTSASLRILVVGDSVSGNLAEGLALVARDRFTVANGSIPGTGIARGEVVRLANGRDHVPDWPWQQRWPEMIRNTHPTMIAVLAGAGDYYDRRVDGRWLKFGTPAWDEFYAREFDQAAAVLQSSGARVVMLTYPPVETSAAFGNYTGFAQHDADSHKSDHINALMQAGAARHQFDVVDLHSFLAPGNRFARTIDNVQVRADDGLHLSVEGARLVADWLAPQLVSSSKTP